VAHFETAKAFEAALMALNIVLNLSGWLWKE